MKATSQVDGRWNFWRQHKLPLVAVCLVYQTLDGCKPFQIVKLKKKKKEKEMQHNAYDSRSLYKVKSSA